MKKQNYQKLEVCLIALASEDVIRTSGGQHPTGSNELEPDF